MATGEIHEFKSQYALSVFFMELYETEICSGNIKRMINQKRPYRRLWIIEYI
nr:MAG TPA: hypothetical protein [Caudoviricetes sp.]